LTTNRDFLVDYLRSPGFAQPPSGAPHTGTLTAFADGWRAGREPDPRGRALCALGLAGFVDAWSRGLAPWSSAAPLPGFVSCDLEDGERLEARVLPLGRGRPCFAVTTRGPMDGAQSEEPLEVELGTGVESEQVSGGVLHRCTVRWGIDSDAVEEIATLFVQRSGATELPAAVFVQRGGRGAAANRRSRVAAPDADPGALLAPMAGQVTQVLCAPGDRVRSGQTIFVLEAMKLESRVRAPCAGVLAAVAVRTGEHVTHRRVLGRIEPETQRGTRA
jgi:biotin carboxyl carrier protein